MTSKDHFELAIHEAGHAVVAHLVGIAIDSVAIKPKGLYGSGYSRPVRYPVAAIADKLWAEANAISRKLVWVDFKGGRHRYVLRKGYKPARAWFDKADRVCRQKRRATPAPQELVDRMEDLRRRAVALWKKANAAKTRADHIKDLMHTLGGPVADAVFFNMQFEAPRHRPFTKAELKVLGIPKAAYGYAGEHIGNIGAGSDFRNIRRLLKHIDNTNWKEAREFYRRKVERLVRQHRATIERVAKALLRRKTLNGAELAKLIPAPTPL
jgi:hypothetical protein